MCPTGWLCLRSGVRGHGGWTVCPTAWLCLSSGVRGQGSGHGSGGLDCLSDGVAVLKVRGQRSRGGLSVLTG